MQIWTIRGGKPLYGRLRVQGAKNSALPILAACILSPCETELRHCPRLRDVDTALEILRHLGCTARQEGERVYVDSRGLCRWDIPQELMQKMRSSILFLGALLARCGAARLHVPGGCDLGERPIDLHLMALRALGADIREENGVEASAENGLRGTHIHFRIPSVGATENALLAACGAAGETVITGAAREPEIRDLAAFLQKLGADISGAGESVIQVRGFSPVKKIQYSVMSDRIAASTYLCAVAAAGGELTLEDADRESIRSITDALAQMGCEISGQGTTLHLRSDGRLKAAPPVETAAYPGFPTDAQPLLMAASLCAEGESVFMENVFSDRFRHVPELRRLEAKIVTEGRVAVVTGVPELCGAYLNATDLRGGAAMLIAGLRARGETVVSDSGHILRGYEDPQYCLRTLGADIEMYEDM